MCKCSEPVWVRRSKYPLLLLMTSDWEMSVSLSSLVLLLCAADLTMLTFIFRSNKVELNWLTDACWYTGWLMGVGALVDWWVLVHWLTDGCWCIGWLMGVGALVDWWVYCCAVHQQWPHSENSGVRPHSFWWTYRSLHYWGVLERWEVVCSVSAAVSHSLLSSQCFACNSQSL